MVRVAAPGAPLGRALAILAAVALVVGGVVATGAAVTTNAAPSACVKPTTNITNQKMVNYNECRFNELAAMHGPAPTATVTATVTATATATVTASPSASASPTPSPTPTSTPSTTPSPTEPPASGWPDASNTGPTGTLTTYTGPLTITTNGAVIDSKVVNGDLSIRAAGVVIKNSRINGSVFSDEFTAYSFTIQDSLVDVGDQAGTGVGEVNFTMLRTEVIGGNRSVNCWQSCVVRDSYVHGQFTDETGQFHESGIRMGADNEIVHNTIACDAPEVPPEAGCSAGLTGYGDFAAVEDVLVQSNRFLPSPSGGFCAYGGSSGGKPYSGAANNIRFIGNLFERGPNGKCGSYGPITDFNSAAPGNVWSENRWNTGELVPPA